MKATRIIYWILTSIVALTMLFSTYLYFSDPKIAQAFVHIGFPAYFRIELAIAKAIGALVLLLPVAARLKEWAYAGFAITIISAFIAHTASGDPASVRMMPVIFLLLLIGSYLTWHKLSAPQA